MNAPPPAEGEAPAEEPAADAKDAVEPKAEEKLKKAKEADDVPKNPDGTKNEELAANFLFEAGVEDEYLALWSAIAQS